MAFRVVVHGRGSPTCLQVAGEAGSRTSWRALRSSGPGHWCAVSKDLVQAMDALGERPGRGVLTFPTASTSSASSLRERGPGP